MRFNIREANISDAVKIFEMTKQFHEEATYRNDLFTNNLDDFLKNCFEDNPKLFFFVAEFQDNLLGYCAYLHSYSVISGGSIVFPELYVKPEYRALGISSFLYPKVVDVAYKNNSSIVKWLISLKDKRVNQIKEKMGVKIDRDTIILNTNKKSLQNYIDVYFKDSTYETRLIKTYDLLGVFDCIKDLSKETNKELQLDVYQLMDAVFSTNPKINIIVAIHNDTIIGFISFRKGYSTCNGKKISVGTVYVLPKMRGKRIGLSLFSTVSKYAFKNNYYNVESKISITETHKIDILGKSGIHPIKDIRIANFKKEEINKLYE